jgi:membrane-associated phospholipid phosphatase
VLRMARRARRSWVAGILAFVLAAECSAQSPEPPAPPVPADEAKDPPTTPRPRYDDKRRTLRSYGSNLLYNIAGGVTTGNHMPLLVTASLTAPAFAWDDGVVDYFRRHPHEQFGDIGAFMGGVVAFGGLSMGFFVAGRLVPRDRLRASSYDVSQAILVAQLYTQTLKVVVHRERPDESDDLSFPSGHASNAFAAASVIAHHYGIRAAVPAYALATYIAVSRLAANRHHFSDIVAGAGLGWGLGRAVYRRNGRPPDPPRGGPQVTFLPDHDLQGAGIGLKVVVSF